jgi:hypothetical protein
VAKATNLNRALILTGGLFFLYALLGNYLALPGYIRFLERGGTSAAGNAFDLDVLIGATKTILWMFSFQLGVLFCAAAHAQRHNLHTRYIVGGGALWILLWAWPSLPAPGPVFYIVLGSVLLVAIGLMLSRSQNRSTGSMPNTLFLASLMFFAFATWEVCGLGTTGRMLHPTEAAEPIAHNILVTQSSKLMVEFVLAWVLMLASNMPLARGALRADAK